MNDKSTATAKECHCCSACMEKGSNQRKRGVDNMSLWKNQPNSTQPSRTEELKMYGIQEDLRQRQFMSPDCRKAGFSSLTGNADYMKTDRFYCDSTEKSTYNYINNGCKLKFTEDAVYDDSADRHGKFYRLKSMGSRLFNSLRKHMKIFIN